MNGVMLPGNTSAFTERLCWGQIWSLILKFMHFLTSDKNVIFIKMLFFTPFMFCCPSVRKVNGPGTPRPLNRPKVSLANSLAANGLPDSTDNKDLSTEQEADKDSGYVRSHNLPENLSFMFNTNKPIGTASVSPVLSFFVSEVSASGGSLGSSVKNKHPDAEEDMEAEQQEVKRLKFSKDEEEDEDDEDEEEEQEVDTLRPSHASCFSKEAEAMVQEEEEEEKTTYSKENEASSSAAATEDQGRFFSFLF